MAIVCTATEYELSPLRKVSVLGTPVAPSLEGDIVPEIMLLASIFVTARLFQFALILLDVFTTALTCPLFAITSMSPCPVASMFLAFVTSPFILLKASLRNSCMVNELVVILPTKNLLPVGTSVPLTLNISTPLLPSVC